MIALSYQALSYQLSLLCPHTVSKQMKQSVFKLPAERKNIYWSVHSFLKFCFHSLFSFSWVKQCYIALLFLFLLYLSIHGKLSRRLALLSDTYSDAHLKGYINYSHLTKKKHQDLDRPSHHWVMSFLDLLSYFS